MADETTNIQEAGASESSLSPGGGTAHGDLRTKTIADIVSRLGTMSDEDLNGFKKSLVPPSPVSGGQAKNLASIKSSGALKEAVQADLKKIFGEQDTLTEGFIDSAAMLFESAVTARVALEVEGIEEEFEDRLNEANEDFIVKSTERLDSYLDYFASQFMEANAVGIDNGIRQELAESFLNGMKELFETHNVAINADQVDVVKALEEQVEELHERLNEAVDTNAQRANEIEEREIRNIVNTVSEGMTDTDRDRLLTIAENIDYDDASDFRGKIEQVKSTFFEKPAVVAEGNSNGVVLEEVQPVDAAGKVIAEEVTTPVVPTQPGSQMDRYLAALKKPR